MRWHVELHENGTPLRVEHVDDEDVALSTARELAAEAAGGHARASAEEIERVLGRFAEEGLGEIEPGLEETYDINDGVSVVVAGLEDADTDEDCWKCRQVG
jgi:hypothetical protein